MLKAEREQELLYRGSAYRRAIQSYYEAGGALKQFPRTLDDLLKDSRTASGKRHIRALYPDPMNKSEKPEWLLIRARTAASAVSPAKAGTNRSNRLISRRNSRNLPVLSRTRIGSLNFSHKR